MRTPDDWTLGIDFGTSFTVAAIHHDGRTEVLEIDGQQRFPSAVFLTEDGSILVGAAAERRGARSPDRLERTPKRYLDVGQPPIALGDRLVDVTSLVAAVLKVAWEEALRQHGGAAPDEVVLTHPAAWGPRRCGLLEEAARVAGIPSPRLLPEPEAAAIYLAGERAGGAPVTNGEYIAVYDLGGGTFDAAVLRRSEAGFSVVGDPLGDPRIGGEIFDDVLYRHLGQTGLPPDVWASLQNSDEDAWQHANREFRYRVRDAKESVSREATCPIYVPPPVGVELQVTREELENLIRKDLEKTLDVLEANIDQAGIGSSQLAAIYLVGGGSRTPLVGHLVRARFGRAETKGDPKQVVALGAARAGAAAVSAHESTPISDGPDVASSGETRAGTGSAGYALPDPALASPVPDGSGFPPKPFWRRSPVIASVVLLVLLIAGGVAGIAASGGTTTSTSTSTPTAASRVTTTLTSTSAASAGNATGIKNCGNNVFVRKTTTTCPFAEAVYGQYQSKYDATGQGNMTITAYSRGAGRSISTNCVASVQGGQKIVVCTNATSSLITFQQPS
jgi:molecular chaperone DnaK